MGVLWYVTSCFSLAALNIFAVSLIFAILIAMCFGVVLFGLILFEIVCFLGMSVSVPSLVKFSGIMSLNFIFSAASLSSIMRMLVCWILSWTSLKMSSLWGFPGGSVVKHPPANARDTASIPGPGRPHKLQSNQDCAPQLLSLCCRVWEPQLLSPCALQQEMPSQ